LLDIGWVCRPKPGENRCGDEIVVCREHDPVLVAVVDGLGHGPQAAMAAQAAADFVLEHTDLPTESFFRACDRALIGTRGVAMSVVRIHESTSVMTFAGVGNVELTAVSREAMHAYPRPGVVGGRLRRVVEMSFRLHPGDTIAMFTDGISSRFELRRLLGPAAQQLAEDIVRIHGKDHDDASCACIRR
jgi:negative regulator of sigma-B (phosphoserine phosphatase)